MSSPRPKDQRIETARGLAILLMVAGHVVGYTSASGLRVADDSMLRLGYTSLELLRLPLFTVISGFVYALRPVTPGSVATFMRGKARRLLVPMLVVGSAFFLVQASVPGVNDAPALAELPRTLLYPHAHFWYLPALFWVFCGVTLLEWGGVLGRAPLWAACTLLAACMAPLPALDIALLAVGGAVYLLPFFLLGLGLARFATVLRVPRMLWLLAGVALLTVTLRQLAVFSVLDLQVHRTTALSMAGGFACSALLLYLGPRWTPLARLGQYSYGIYLLHVFATAATRIALNRLGVESLAVHFVVGLAAGIATPILAEWVLDQHGLGRLLVLGRRYTPIVTPSVPERAPDNELLPAQRPSRPPPPMGRVA